MKKIIFLLLAFLSFGSCGVQDGTTTFLHSAITCYIDGPMQIFSYYDVDSRLAFDIQMLEEVSYRAPEIGGTGKEAEEFLRLAAQNKDRTYDREVPFYEFKRTCCVDNFQSVEIVCTDAAWDENHPAGTPLNDLMDFVYVSYTAYIQSGYGNVRARYEKPLSELSESDMTMVLPHFVLYVRSVPDPGSYNIKLTLTTTEGVEKTATCTLEIE